MAEKTVTVKIEDLPKVQALLDEAQRQIEWHTKIRLDIESVLDEVLGTEEEAGAGGGIVADVRLALAKERAAGVQAGREAAAAALYAYDRTDRNRLITLDMAARIARGDNQEARVCTCGNREGFYGTAGELPRTRQSVPERDPECPFHGRDQ